MWRSVKGLILIIKALKLFTKVKLGVLGKEKMSEWVKNNLFWQLSWMIKIKQLLFKKTNKIKLIQSYTITFQKKIL